MCVISWCFKGNTWVCFTFSCQFMIKGSWTLKRWRKDKSLCILCFFCQHYDGVMLSVLIIVVFHATDKSLSVFISLLPCSATDLKFKSDNMILKWSVTKAVMSVIRWAKSVVHFTFCLLKSLSVETHLGRFPMIAASSCFMSDNDSIKIMGIQFHFLLYTYNLSGSALKDKAFSVCGYWQHFLHFFLQRNSSLSGSTRGMYQVSERRSSPSTG